MTSLVDNKITLNFQWNGIAKTETVQITTINLLFHSNLFDMCINLPSTISLPQRLPFVMRTFTMQQNADGTVSKMLKGQHESNGIKLREQQVLELKIQAVFIEQTDGLKEDSKGATGQKVKDVQLALPKKLELGKRYLLQMSSDNLTLSARLVEEGEGEKKVSKEEATQAKGNEGDLKESKEESSKVEKKNDSSTISDAESTEELYSVSDEQMKTDCETLSRLIRRELECTIQMYMQCPKKPESEEEKQKAKKFDLDLLSEIQKTLASLNKKEFCNFMAIFNKIRAKKSQIYGQAKEIVREKGLLSLAPEDETVLVRKKFLELQHKEKDFLEELNYLILHNYLNIKGESALENLLGLYLGSHNNAKARNDYKTATVDVVAMYAKVPTKKDNT